MSRNQRGHQRRRHLRGTFSGTTTWSAVNPAHAHDMDFVFVGTGDDEGLQFVATMEGTGYPWSITGQIGPVD